MDRIRSPRIGLHWQAETPAAGMRHGAPGACTARATALPVAACGILRRRGRRTERVLTDE
jgi:hypothetical protein